MRGVAGLAVVAALAAAPALAADKPAIRSFVMPSASMEPTLREDDVFFVAPIATPTRGDVLVFTPPGRPEPWVKRLIGLPGDRIQMKDGVLLLNGRAVSRVDDGPGPKGACWNGAEVRRLRETTPEGRSYLTFDCGPRGDLDDTEEYVVPAGHYFLMGDNRDNSNDSRAEVGMVPAANLIGVARTLLPSPERQKTDARPLIPIE